MGATESWSVANWESYQRWKGAEALEGESLLEFRSRLGLWPAYVHKGKAVADGIPESATFPVNRQGELSFCGAATAEGVGSQVGGKVNQ